MEFRDKKIYFCRVYLELEMIIELKKYNVFLWNLLIYKYNKCNFDSLLIQNDKLKLSTINHDIVQERR
jgi:hypothetical protein